MFRKNHIKLNLVLCDLQERKQQMTFLHQPGVLELQLQTAAPSCLSSSLSLTKYIIMNKNDLETGK